MALFSPEFNSHTISEFTIRRQSEIGAAHVQSSMCQTANRGLRYTSIDLSPLRLPAIKLIFDSFLAIDDDARIATKFSDSDLFDPVTHTELDDWEDWAHEKIEYDRVRFWFADHNPELKHSRDESEKLPPSKRQRKK